MAKLRIRKSLAAVIISASAMVAVAAPALAERDFVGGGTWDHGLTGLDVYSNYYHPNNDHRSSVVVNGNDMTLNLAVTYNSFANTTQHGWAIGVDKGGLNTKWADLGAVTLVN